LFIIISSVYSVDFNSNENNNNQNSIFVIYPRLYLCNNGSFSFEFRTKTRNGLIFYTNDNYHDDDSILVSIYQGKLVVEQIFGKTKFYQQFDQSVHDDKWYKIVFKRRSSLLTDIVLYSVALRNVENRIIKSKSLNYLPFTSINTSSMVYIGGLPRNLYQKQRYSSEFLFESFQGFVRNLRYGLCGCPERIQYPLFSSLSMNLQSEVCEQQISLCSSTSCECLNVDEEPRYQCDCSNKTCSIMTLMSKLLCCKRKHISNVYLFFLVTLEATAVIVLSYLFFLFILMNIMNASCCCQAIIFSTYFIFFAQFFFLLLLIQTEQSMPSTVRLGCYRHILMEHCLFSRSVSLICLHYVCPIKRQTYTR
jgi:hypothetical protein